ncbi:hypothetical protein HDU98_004236 [Podochytrium sp. JEL0797]|nr:hypothetical protein HDU98_004236 [Podochytrium sp. JEL0797]
MATYLPVDGIFRHIRPAVCFLERFKLVPYEEKDIEAGKLVETEEDLLEQSKAGAMFAGVNSYFLQTLPKKKQRTILAALQDAGVTVVRVFITSFNPNGKGTDSLGVDDLELGSVGIYNDYVLQRLDTLLSIVGGYGIQLIIVMHDRWNLDGTYNICDAYCQAFCSDGNGLSGFYNNQDAFDAFDARLAYIAERKNPLMDNRMWKDIPEAILAFEIQNEAMGTGALDSRDQMTNPNWWCDRATTLRAVMSDSEVLIGTGGGQNFASSLVEQNFACADLDIIGLHSYSSDIGEVSDNLNLAQQMASQSNQMVYFEEFGAQSDKGSWITQVADVANSLGIPWLPWEVSSVSVTDDYEFWQDDADALLVDSDTEDECEPAEPMRIVPKPPPRIPEDPADPMLRPNFPHLSLPLGSPLPLGSLDGRPIAVNAAIHRYLRSYQKDGAAFLFGLYAQGKGGLLCDDMGLGKTIQVIAFLSAVLNKTGLPHEKSTRKLLFRSGNLVNDPTLFRALIVCPTSVIYNWERELDTWGYFSHGIYHGSQRAETLKNAKKGVLEIAITSFATARNYQHELNEIPWSCIIVDECHQLKETTSQTTKAMKSFSEVKSRFGLTGTAIQNKYRDLWCILDFCNPGSVGEESHFENSVSIPLKRGQAFDATLREIAAARHTATRFRELVLERFMLRRTKSLIAHQLPKKEDKIVFCPMSDSQKRAYAALLQSEAFQLLIRRDETEGVPIAHTVLPALVTLQKVSNHMALIMPDQSDPKDKQAKDKSLVQSAFPAGPPADQLRMTWINMRNPEFCGKWRVLEKLLSVWHKLSSKVLLFSASVKLLNMLEILMSDKTYSYSRLDGKTPIGDRLHLVDKFNNDPNQFVFLISTRAGGVGLNLTSANVVVIFDPNWNPSHDLQAQDRAFRIGQLRDVNVYRLIAAGSLEEVIYGRQVYKQQQANIGYDASEERRLFNGVQGDPTKKGELFGLDNLLSIYTESDVITKLIIDKLEKAENKFLIQEGQVAVASDEIRIVDMVPPVAVEEEEGGELLEEEGEGPSRKKRKVSDQGGVEDEDVEAIQKAFKDCTEDEKDKLAKRERDAVSAILSGHDIAYTHVNSDILGSSKAEKLITKDAARALETGQSTQEPVYGFAPDDDVDDAGEITEEGRQTLLIAMAVHKGMSTTEFAELVARSSREEREVMLERFRRSLN